MLVVREHRFAGIWFGTPIASSMVYFHEYSFEPRDMLHIWGNMLTILVMLDLGTVEDCKH